MKKAHRKWYERTRTYTKITGESMTTQSDRDPSDVNYIVRRFQRTGELPPNPRGLEPRYEDVTGLQENLTDAYNKALATTEAYNQFLTEQQQQEQQEQENNNSEENTDRLTAEAVAEGEGKGA